ncbi:MAG: hypothetical protein ACRD0H_22140, partial [Actinomycetes bacterium]
PLAVASVAVGLWASQLSYGIVRQRERTRNGRLVVPESTFALAWVAVGPAATAVIVTVLSRTLSRSRGPGVLADTVIAFFAGEIVAILAAIVTRAWLVAVAAAGSAVITVVAALGLRHPAKGNFPASVPRVSGWWGPILLVVTLLAVVVMLLLLGTVYSDAPTRAHLCSD